MSIEKEYKAKSQIFGLKCSRGKQGGCDMNLYRREQVEDEKIAKPTGLCEVEVLRVHVISFYSYCMLFSFTMYSIDSLNFGIFVYGLAYLKQL